MKKARIVALAVIMTVLLARSVHAASVQLRFSQAGPRTSTWNQGAEKFASIVRERTGSKFSITVFPSDELSGGDQAAGIGLLQTGVTDIHLQDALVWSSVAKKSIVPCFPWLLPTYEDVDKYMRGSGGNALKQVLNEAGVVCLAIGENGYRQVVNNRNPIRKPEDMKGLRVRVPGSDVHVDLLKHIGAEPLTMNQSEVYSSLQKGAIDACENTLDLLFTQGTLTAVKYISLWNYSYDPIYLSVSRKLWDTLNDGERAVFQFAAEEAMAYQIQVAREKDDALRKSLYTFPVEIVASLTPEELGEFKKKVQRVYEDNQAEFGELFRQFGYVVN
ncbi:MAG: TRAP transporter substrate-binding protein DctP [Synergistaceae bacterium]|nr:TRAP transporter substrate-binding protein DctP [Synergistaceae bacterium]